MATARELLEQADAMMRKNRGALRRRYSGADRRGHDDGMPSSACRLADIPDAERTELEDVVVRDPSTRTNRAEAAASVFEGDPSDWLVMDTVDPALHSVTGKAPDTLAVVPPVAMKTTEPARSPRRSKRHSDTATHKAAGSAATPPRRSGRQRVAEPIYSRRVADDYLLLAAAEYSQPSAPSVPVPTVAEAVDSNPTTASDERWQAVAEQISMQVLQRIDLFTDTGLKEQLARHLQPIVDRASAELVGEINEQVGKLVRSYVAEAIEREIAQWRSDHH